MRKFVLLFLAFVLLFGCEDAKGPALGGGVIDVEDLTFNIEISTVTPIVYNEGRLTVCLTSNRSKIRIGSITSEFEFPDIEPGAIYDINGTLSFSSATVLNQEEGEGCFSMTVIDDVSGESRELSVTYTKTTDYEIRPSSITLTNNNLSISMDESVEIGYSINPVQSHGNISIKRVDIYDTVLSYELDTEKSVITVTGGSVGGKARLKAYAVADTNVCTYLDLYVKHRVALELDIKSTGDGLDVFWRRMPTKATARLVTWNGKIDEGNSQKYDLSIKEFTLPTEYKASFYVNINTNQVGRECKYFRGGNDKKKWRDDIKWVTSSKKYSQWGEKHTAVQWSWYKHIKNINRYSTYKSTKNLTDELITDQPGYQTLPLLLKHFRDNNDYRWTSNDGNVGAKFNNGWWTESAWQLYYITVENIVFDRDRLDLEYVFHRYRMKVNDAYYSGKYYWCNVDQGSWAIKVE